jgi:tetratricopeptide (TPR) repeat protein
MKKYIVVGVTTVLMLLLFSSCASIDLSPYILAGFNQMNAGNIEEAEEYFQEVLRRDNAQPDANLGLSLISLFKGNRDLLEFSIDDFPSEFAVFAPAPTQSRDIQKAQLRMKLLAAAIKTKTSRDTIEPIDLSGIRDFINASQEDLSAIVALLEKARICLEKAMDEAQPREIQPNKFDWNGNGTIESDSALLFSGLLDGLPVWQLVAEGMYLFQIPNEEGASPRLFDKTGGDAWFDKELFDRILSGEEIDIGTWIPVFDDTDVFTIGVKEIRWLYLFVTAELTVLEPLVVYSFDFGEETEDFYYEYIEWYNTFGYESAVQWALRTLDSTQDGTITNQEWRAQMGEGFLAFRPEDENGGAHAIENWQSAIVGFCETGIEMLRNDEIPLFGSLQTPRLYQRQLRDSLSSTETIVAILEEVKAYVTDPTKGFVLLDTEAETSSRSHINKLLNKRAALGIKAIDVVATAFPGVFFAEWQSFSDLKSFIPDVHYVWDTENAWFEEFLLRFADPTFGGFLQVLVNNSPWDGFIHRLYD